MVRQLAKKWLQSESGVAAPEIMMIISVVVIGVVASAVTFVPTFQSGVMDIGQDVERILRTHEIGQGIDAGEQTETNQQISLPFDGMLENVGGARNASLVLLSFLIAGALLLARKGQLNEAGMRDANAMLMTYQARGGRLDDIHRAHANIESHNGDVQAAYDARNGQFFDGNYRPENDPFQVRDSNGKIINGRTGGTQSA